MRKFIRKIKDVAEGIIEVLSLRFKGYYVKKY